MSPPAATLARRAVACKGWRWMPGMLTFNRGAWRVVDVSSDWLSMDDLQGSGHGFRPGEVLPDISDPATLGCLLALVREAWVSRSQGVSVMRRWLVDGSTVDPGGRWEVWRTEPDGPHVLGSGASEAEALVAALEAAPS